VHQSYCESELEGLCTLRLCCLPPVTGPSRHVPARPGEGGRVLRGRDVGCSACTARALPAKPASGLPSPRGDPELNATGAPGLCSGGCAPADCGANSGPAAVGAVCTMWPRVSPSTGGDFMEVPGVQPFE
jgi:hypothetical protein